VDEIVPHQSQAVDQFGNQKLNIIASDSFFLMVHWFA